MIEKRKKSDEAMSVTYREPIQLTGEEEEVSRPPHESYGSWEVMMSAEASSSLWCGAQKEPSGWRRWKDGPLVWSRRSLRGGGGGGRMALWCGVGGAFRVEGWASGVELQDPSV